VIKFLGILIAILLFACPASNAQQAAQIQLATVTTTGGQAAIQFQALSTYTNFRIACSNLVTSASDFVILQFGTGAGPTYDTTSANYTYAETGMQDGTGGALVSFSQTANAVNGIGLFGYPTSLSAGNSPGSIDMTLVGLTATTSKNVQYQAFAWDGAHNAAYTGGGAYFPTTVVTAIRLLPTAGTFNAGGTCILYGLLT
jgi:hypothetical protein